MKKRKLNTRFLRKIQRHILAEPMRLDMMTFADTKQSYAFRPPCGTTGCIAGWGLILSGSKPETVANMDMASIASKAAKLLGISYVKPAGYDSDGWGEPWFDSDSEAANLFLVRFWPAQFSARYEKLNSEMKDRAYNETATRRFVSSVRRRLAKITSDRIDYFIKNRE